ncbi:MAG: hypothetical protein AAGA90_24015 [Actinomycetota bacterium]
MTDIDVTIEADTEIERTDGWPEWPESDLEIDDEAFAEAIARGRELEAAA